MVFEKPTIPLAALPARPNTAPRVTAKPLTIPPVRTNTEPIDLSASPMPPRMAPTVAIVPPRTRNSASPFAIRMNSSLCWLTKLWMGLTILDIHVATCFNAGAMA